MEKKLIRVRDIMRTRFEYIDGTDTIRVALEKMQTTDARILIVNKRHANDEFGVLMLDDIAKQVMARDKSPDRVNVYEIMSKPAIQVSPDMDIRYCARLFERYSIIRAPVVEQDSIMGIVSYNVLVLRGLMQLL